MSASMMSRDDSLAKLLICSAAAQSDYAHSHHSGQCDCGLSISAFASCICQALGVGDRRHATLLQILTPEFASCLMEQRRLEAKGCEQKHGDDDDEEDYEVLDSWDSCCRTQASLLLADEMTSPSGMELIEAALSSVTRQALTKGCYDSRARAGLKRACQWLESPGFWAAVVRAEMQFTASCLNRFPLHFLLDGDQNGRRKVKHRGLKIGAAAAGSGCALYAAGMISAPSILASLAALGGAASLAAPSLAAYLSWVASAGLPLTAYMGVSTSAAAAAATPAISSTFGVVGASTAGYGMTQRTAGVREFHFLPLLGESIFSPEKCEDRGLPVFICVGGCADVVGHDARHIWGGGLQATAARGREVPPDTEKDDSDIGDGSSDVGPRPLRRDELWEPVLVADGSEEEILTLQRRPTYCDATACMSSSTASSDASESEGWEALPDHPWWRDFFASKAEEHVLIWERQVLEEVADAIREIVWQSASRRVIGEFLRQSLYLKNVLNAAALPLSLLDIVGGLASPWTLVLERAEACGLLLAERLLDAKRRARGSRPVTLIGYSFGAAVIFAALQRLAAAGPHGIDIVENAVLIGAPVCSSRLDPWRKARGVVAGRLINCFSSRDWILALIYRTKTWSLGVAGTAAITENGLKIENLNLSERITYHLSYPALLPYIFSELHLEQTG
jgi:hypothetical protein